MDRIRVQLWIYVRILQDCVWHDQPGTLDTRFPPGQYLLRGGVKQRRAPNHHPEVVKPTVGRTN